MRNLELEMERLFRATDTEDFECLPADDGGLELQTSKAILHIRKDGTWTLDWFGD